MLQQVITPKKKEVTPKPEINKKNNTNKNYTISLEYIFLNFH
jgi:hypothetical protein